MTVLVTGATGFVGRTLCKTLVDAGYRVRAALRTARPVDPAIAESVVVGDIGSKTDWSEALRGVDRVVHAAARVHMMRDTPEAAHLYDETNVAGTRELAAAAARAGVRRLVYLSSIKVNGEESGDRRYSASDPPAPQDSYGVSKWQAERSIREVSGASSLEFAIVRPPLVYGPGVGANFRRLLAWVARGVPLPFGAVANQRSLVNVWNLSDLILSLLIHPSAAGGTFLVSDGKDLSTPELIRGLAQALGRQARLLPVPPAALMLLGKAAGKEAEVKRLCGSLTVDISAAESMLGWKPPVDVDTGLSRTARWYLESHGGESPDAR